MSGAGLRVEAAGLAKAYPGGSTAIAGLSFRIGAGERVCLVGPTGCGKSTLLRLLAGLERPTAGTVRVESRDPAADFEWFRGRLAMVFQEDRLLPWRTALDNAALGLEMLRVRRGQRLERARRWLVRLGLEDSLHAYPGQLSGGMRQRVALARAFAIEPRLVLADEAFGQLDEATAARLRCDFFETARRQGTTVLLVTHRLEEAIGSAERVLVLGRPGRLLADLDVAAEIEEQGKGGLRRRLRSLLDGES